MSDEPTPILRADATDDDLQDESFEHEGPCEGVEHPPGFEPESKFHGGEPGKVEPELRMKARMIPVVVQGVLHGYRKEE